MQVERKYFLVNNYFKLGEFYVHHGSAVDNPRYSCLRPVIKNTIIHDNKSSYITGFLDLVDNFYECPFSIFYCQIVSLTSNKEKCENSSSNKYTLDVSMKVFDKNFRNNCDIKGQFTGTSYSNVDVMSINKIINLINLYVDNGNDIEKINSVVLFSNLFKSHNEENIFKQVNLLEFSFFSNDRMRVGKDNYFWNEIEIRNLPNDPYLSILLRNSITKIKSLESCRDNETYLVVSYDRSAGYCPSEGRKPIVADFEMQSLIKDHLKLGMVTGYNFNDDFFQRLQK